MSFFFAQLVLEAENGLHQGSANRQSVRGQGSSPRKVGEDGLESVNIGSNRVLLTIEKPSVQCSHIPDHLSGQKRPITCL